MLAKAAERIKKKRAAKAKTATRSGDGATNYPDPAVQPDSPTAAPEPGTP